MKSLAGFGAEPQAGLGGSPTSPPPNVSPANVLPANVLPARIGLTKPQKR